MSVQLFVKFVSDDFTQLPGISAKKEKQLKESGFSTYEDLVCARVSDIRDIVGLGYGKVIELVNEAVSLMRIECPECCGTLMPQFGTPVINDTDEDLDVTCEICDWCGYVDEAADEKDLTIDIETPSNH